MDNQEIYLNLASTDLQNNRSIRYDGGGFSISFNDMVAEDISLVMRLYQSLKSIYDLWLYMSENPNYQLLRTHLTQLCSTEFITEARAIGNTTYNVDKSTPKLRKAFHDIRGGALSSLTGYAKLIPRLPEDDTLVRKAVFLARDHAKMMRNILPDLDIPIRAADESAKLHRIREFVDKWDQVTVEMEGKYVQVLVESNVECYITNRCLESSAVDRVLYNYINNAIRFSAGESIGLSVIRVNNSIIRWVVKNEITHEQKMWLQENLDNELSKLFQGGYTKGGQGIGLSNCSDLVSSSFGLSVSQAIESGYLGAKILNNTYYAWFHWPIYLPENENEKICDCRT